MLTEAQVVEMEARIAPGQSLGLTLTTIAQLATDMRLLLADWRRMRPVVEAAQLLYQQISEYWIQCECGKRHDWKDITQPENVAKWCYGIADALLRQRQEG